MCGLTVYAQGAMCMCGFKYTCPRGHMHVFLGVHNQMGVCVYSVHDE